MTTTQTTRPTITDEQAAIVGRRWDKNGTVRYYINDWTGLMRMQAVRGPRHLVYGTVRAGEYRAVYATSAAEAEQTADRFAGDRLRQVRTVAPVTVETDHADMLRQTGEQWREARSTEVDLRQQVAAATVSAVEAGMSESEAARLTGADRMTVRAWLGKGKR